MLTLPTVATIADDLLAFGDIFEHDKNEEDDELDVRLQVRDNGNWEIHYGLPCYDTNRRGYWGAAIINECTNRTEAEAVAQDLISQVKKHHSQQ